MRLVLFEPPGGGVEPGVLTARGVVGAGDLLGATVSPQAAMVRVIDEFDDLRGRLQARAANAEALSLGAVRLWPPLPRPGKILCSTARYLTSVHDEPAGGKPEPAPLLMTLKSAESVIGPGGTIVLPAVGAEWAFVPEAELGVVIAGPARNVTAADWRDVVFGYTCSVDVMARGDQQLGRDLWLAKADTLGPLGPCIVTADEVADPNTLRLQSWRNGQAYQRFSMGDSEYGVPAQVAFATTVMTLYSGDVIACGSAATTDLPALAAGDTFDMEIEVIGRLSLSVSGGPA
jgi:2-keto-4-pentenoate hydratase/2-oxohepta-3-ene-1,7-dioic acid hydratase in catechol pathway